MLGGLSKALPTLQTTAHASVCVKKETRYTQLHAGTSPAPPWTAGCRLGARLGHTALPGQGFVLTENTPGRGSVSFHKLWPTLPPRGHRLGTPRACGCTPGMPQPGAAPRADAHPAFPAPARTERRGDRCGSSSFLKTGGHRTPQTTKTKPPCRRDTARTRALTAGPPRTRQPGRTFLGLVQLELLLVVPAQRTLVLSVRLHAKLPSEAFHVVCGHRGRP